MEHFNDITDVNCNGTCAIVQILPLLLKNKQKKVLWFANV